MLQIVTQNKSDDWTNVSCCDCRTGLAVSGADFAIVASDSRLSEGFSIHSRDAPKTYQL